MKKKIGAGIIAIDKNSGQILLGRRGMDCSFPNCWTPFGGTFEEKDGIPKEAAKREFWEETGIKSEYKISKEPYYINNNKFLDFYTYLAFFDVKPEVTINDESLDYAWVDIENIPFNIHPGFKELLSHKEEDLKRIIDKIRLSKINVG
jgi:8-oxo-dGTP pyrophosphatase MutT (NUDIX family)